MSRWPADDIPHDVWLRFLNDAVRGLLEAARQVNEPARRMIFERRPGWFGKPKKDLAGTRLPDETSISKALIEIMRETRAAQFIAAPSSNPAESDLTRMEFHVEVDREFDPAIGPRAQPTDIQIAISRDRIDLRIEAKKLTTPGDIAADYLGADGLGRFNDVNAPYTLERFGGMIAYVTDRDAATWTEMVAEGLKGAVRPEDLALTTVSGQDLMTSTHIRYVDIEVHGVKGCFRTDVIHMVAEFEARPSRRIPSASGRRGSRSRP